MNDSAAVLVGSAISAIVALAVVGFQFFLERRRQLVAERAARLRDFLAISYTASTATGQVAQANPIDKPAIEAAVRSAHEDRLNEKLASLRLLEDVTVVEAATNVERELTRLMQIAGSQIWTNQDWRHQWVTLARLTHDYESIARRSLNRKPLAGEMTFYEPPKDLGST